MTNQHNQHEAVQCMDCHSQHLNFPNSPQYFDVVICKDCGAEYTYGTLRNNLRNEQYEVPPVYGVQECSE